jgi:hypothetical protein
MACPPVQTPIACAAAARHGEYGGWDAVELGGVQEGLAAGGRSARSFTCFRGCIDTFVSFERRTSVSASVKQRSGAALDTSRARGEMLGTEDKPVGSPFLRSTERLHKPPYRLKSALWCKAPVFSWFATVQPHHARARMRLWSP